MTSYGVIRAKQKLGFNVGSCVGQYPRLGRAAAGCRSRRGHIVATQRRMFLWREYEARLQKSAIICFRLCLERIIKLLDILIFFFIFQK